MRAGAMGWPPASIGKVVAVGVLGGLLAGIFGVGGGIVMVPLPVSYTHLDVYKRQIRR